MKQKRSCVFIGLLVLVFFITACSKQKIAEGGDCKKIAFVISEDTDLEIFSICPDGSGLTNLTESAGDDFSPAWSPEGRRLAFVSERSESSQVYLMQADGSQQTMLTPNYQNDEPVWLPDGKQIAVRTTDGSGLWWWRLVNLEEGKTSNLTDPSFDFFFNKQTWSPDGKKIAYMSLIEQQKHNDGSSQIHVKNTDGTEDQALTADIWATINPVWSPDGNWIAFLSERDGTYNSFALYVIGKDGRKLKKLSEAKYSEFAVFTWSSDGTQIALSDLFRKCGISIIDVKTGKSKPLPGLSIESNIFSPSWQP